MIAVGAALVLVGGTGTVLCVQRSLSAARPVAVLAALATPIAVLAALTGGVLLFVPGFFS